MAECKKVVIAGIPGSGSTQFCEGYEQANIHRLRILNFNMGEILLESAKNTLHRPPIPAENLLNLNPELLSALQKKAFDKVLLKIKNSENSCDRILIDMHCQFFWNDIFWNAYDWSDLSELGADMSLQS